MTYQTPCSSPENNPDDWYIGKDGRQYPDDELTEEEIRINLRKRRHARDACYVDCLVRTQCLDVALTRSEEHGTWGAYYEEQLRAIRAEMARRKRAKEMVQDGSKEQQGSPSERQGPAKQE